MKKSKGIFMLWAFALILLLAFLPSASDPIHAGTTARQFTGAQAWDEYEGTIPMNLVTVVGETGNEYSTALSQIAAIPLNIRSDGYLTAAGLLLPDSITHPQESPLEEWLALADNSIDELVFIGNVSNHTYLSSLADEFTEISGANHYEVASEIALEYFQGTQAVVVAYAGSLDDIFNVQTLVDASGEHLGPPQVDTISASTTPSRDWEWMGSVAPSGGGIICEFSSDGGNYMSIDLLAQRGTEYYSLDYGYTSEMRVRYPYENSPHEDWKLHVIDWYDESRTVDFDFEVKSIAADTYTVNVNPGEDCRIDIDVDFGASQVRGGLHILGPTGELILNANRYSMLTEVPGFGEVYNIRASLSHPMPGDYEIFVTNSEDYSISYDLSIVKNTVKDEWQASAASSANAASLASILGAPILYTDSDSLTTTTLNAIAALKPEEVWIVDPLSGISSAVTAQLASLAEEVNELKSFREVHNELTGRAMLPRTGGRVTLYDSQGTHFVPAALSATKRHD
ncbi:MAG: hypothetical protein EAX95_14530, partial [Candidatus Thorarchaeota archaeon]|nr:hypothetical protein [Candidatus Thorarchaeota archaeon]